MIWDWLPNLAVGWGVQLLGVLSPGPGVALILAIATTRASDASWATTCRPTRPEAPVTSTERTGRSAGPAELTPPARGASS